MFAVQVRLVTANAFAGQELGDVFPSLAPFARANQLRPMCKLPEVDWAAEDVDVVFACLPHGVTQESVKTLPAHLKVRWPCRQICAYALGPASR